ncbi:hypothetical protein GQ55_3G291300 [Panicum hallii var. hallii]|uniref:Uncharacterized protein n=1 Tax=Panicum hallii var. hallii TaxID=1504633 RepID=A0A2T7EEI2_9POAL|nr:hypothetical protein GQ55_3G291300 [Panicum hallii var. hallii]
MTCRRRRQLRHQAAPIRPAPLPLLHQPGPTPSRRAVSPPAACSPKSAAARCSATAYRKPCLFFCGKCCAACLCVPAGTYGNKASCPCYSNWKTTKRPPVPLAENCNEM